MVYSKFFTSLGNAFRNPTAPANVALTLDKNELELNIENMSEKQLEKWINSVRQLVLFNR